MGNWFQEEVENEVGYRDILEKANNGDFHEWNFEPFLGQGTGYEDVMSELRSYTAEEYNGYDEKYKEAKKAGNEEDALKYKEKMDTIVDRVLDIYRSKNIFPITYYSDLGVYSEIARCLDYEASFNGDTVSCGAGVGSGLCCWLFPNIFDTPSAHDLDKKGAETQYKKFLSDEYLRRAIKFCFSYKNGSPVPSAVDGGLRLVGSAPTNFRPMNAKAIYERFCPKGGTIYDFCCGFGGRLLGALSSKNNYRYVGTDPCTETMYHLHQLGEYIEQVTGRENSYELHCCGSEDFKGPKNSIDFAFSSPPYFNLEVYSDEETQCYNKFPVLEDWLEGYVRKTIQNIGYMLRPGSVYAVNIADFTIKGKKEVAYVDEWIRLSKEEGMPLYDIVYLGVTARAGTKLQAQGEMKKENILIFKKPLW